MRNAEHRRNVKLREALKKRPGFGSSSSSAADHLNEIVGLTKQEPSKREQRDQRIEQAAKAGAGCRRFELAGGPTKFPGKPAYMTSAVGSDLKAKRLDAARQAFLDRLVAEKRAQKST